MKSFKNTFSSKKVYTKIKNEALFAAVALAFHLFFCCFPLARARSLSACVCALFLLFWIFERCTISHHFISFYSFIYLTLCNFGRFFISRMNFLFSCFFATYKKIWWSYCIYTNIYVGCRLMWGIILNINSKIVANGLCQKKSESWRMSEREGEDIKHVSRQASKWISGRMNARKFGMDIGLRSHPNRIMHVHIVPLLVVAVAVVAILCIR